MIIIINKKFQRFTVKKIRLSSFSGGVNLTSSVLLTRNSNIIIYKHFPCLIRSMHLPTKPTASYNSIQAIVIKDRKPKGKFKFAPSAKGIVTVFITNDGLTGRILKHWYPESRRNYELRKVFISYLESNVKYVVSISVRKGRHNICYLAFDKKNVITKEGLSAVFDEFIMALKFKCEAIKSEEIKKYRDRLISIDYIKIIFEPVNNCSPDDKDKGGNMFKYQPKPLLERSLGSFNLFYSTSLFPINYLFDVSSMLVRTSTDAAGRLKWFSRDRSFYTGNLVRVNSTGGRMFSTLNNNVSDGYIRGGGSLNMFPDEIVDVFKSRVKRNVACMDECKGNDPRMVDILQRVQLFMENAELGVGGMRSGTLDTESWFLTAALSIVQNKEYNSWEKQLAVEVLSIHYESRFIGEILKSIQNGNVKTVPGLIIRLLNKSLPHFVDVVNAYLDKSLKLVKEFNVGNNVSVKSKLTVIIHILEPTTVASIVFANVVRTCGKAGGIEEMALINDVIDNLLTHLRLAELSKNKKIPQAIQSIWGDIRNDIIYLTAIEKVEIGQALVDMCLKACDDLFKKECVMVSAKERANMVIIKNEFLVTLSELAFNPLRLPMIHKPIEWSLNRDAPTGGYLHPVYNELVNSKGLVHSEVGSKKHSEISIDQINAVNFLNGQEFRINEEMLDYLLSEWKRDDSVIFSVYNKPSTETSFSPEVQRHNSVYWMYRNALNIALLLRSEVLYFPVFMDFRGRIYPLVNYLSYQGGDIARSLLMFNRDSNNPSDNKSSENKHILVYLCNVFGHNKRSMENRIKWAENTLPHMAELYEQDRDRFEKEYLIKAKEKAQFMSCFLSVYKSFHPAKGSHNYINSKIPVLFDATCSGMQHLSALTTNIDLAVLVNLTNHELNDFYAYCANIVQKVIAGLCDKKLSESLGMIKIDRKLIKLPVMTIPYNIGMESLTKKITDKFETRFDELADGKKKLIFIVPGELTVTGAPLQLTGHEAGKLGSIIYHTVKSLMTPILPLKQYFDGMINVLEKLNKPIFWITPAGMKIWGSVLDTEAKRVKTSILKNSNPITIRIPTDKYAYKSIKRGFMANFIHSLDAANIHYLIKIIQGSPEYKNKIINLYTIHDCFASVNNEMRSLEHLVRKAFAYLYFEQDYLVELDTCLMGQIKTYCNDVQISKTGVRTVSMMNPKTGEIEVLNIPTLPVFNWEKNKEILKEQIIKSEYFIS